MAERSVRELRFDLQLYREDAVRAAIEVFAAFVQAEVAIEGSCAVVHLMDMAPEHAEVLPLELANYALFETAVRRRGVKL